jgi:hypothetical protein
MRVSRSGFWADEAQCRRQDHCLGLGRCDRMWLRLVASHATEGHETNPRRLVSEVGPSETGRCVSGAGEPSCNKTPHCPATTLQLKMG